MTRAAIVALLFLLGAAAYGAEETIVSKRINAQNRLVPLTKVTVGPDDQYRASVDPTGEILVYTKKSDLVPHLCRMSLRTGEEANLLPLVADSSTLR